MTPNTDQQLRIRQVVGQMTGLSATQLRTLTSDIATVRTEQLREVREFARPFVLSNPVVTRTEVRLEQPPLIIRESGNQPVPQVPPLDTITLDDVCIDGVETPVTFLTTT